MFENIKLNCQNATAVQLWIVQQAGAVEVLVHEIRTLVCELQTFEQVTRVIESRSLWIAQTDANSFFV